MHNTTCPTSSPCLSPLLPLLQPHGPPCYFPSIPSMHLLRTSVPGVPSARNPLSPDTHIAQLATFPARTSQWGLPYPPYLKLCVTPAHPLLLPTLHSTCHYTDFLHIWPSQAPHLQILPILQTLQDMTAKIIMVIVQVLLLSSDAEQLKWTMIPEFSEFCWNKCSLPWLLRFVTYSSLLTS